MDVLLKINDEYIELKNTDLQLHDYNIYIKLDMDKSLFKKLKKYNYYTEDGKDVEKLYVFFDDILIVVDLMMLEIYITQPKVKEKININIISMDFKFEDPLLYLRKDLITKIQNNFNEKSI